MILKNILLLGSALLLSACQLMSSSNESTQLRFNPAVSVGVLDNGFTYYIAENQRPESRVYIRFVVNAGSTISVVLLILLSTWRSMAQKTILKTK